MTVADNSSPLEFRPTYRDIQYSERRISTLARLMRGDARSNTGPLGVVASACKSHVGIAMYAAAAEGRACVRQQWCCLWSACQRPAGDAAQCSETLKKWTKISLHAENNYHYIFTI